LVNNLLFNKIMTALQPCDNDEPKIKRLLEVKTLYFMMTKTNTAIGLSARKFINQRDREKDLNKRIKAKQKKLRNGVVSMVRIKFLA